ncbi:DUF72 domain-containing protein [Williamsia sterculiae]|uniref:Uncharacterized conserved protein YecE, DUF72 family n=1 Tax=Williamsia sterculiae TaxID=1344003 RepID=A0A1N7DJ15_9NOCA|nr:DUF72 domain-containing protein [Williamsia sterculiae]SIR75843.1 Uncharacterized conserved protein YecE, DUF72 family [Williamsia sterculiae]
MTVRVGTSGWVYPPWRGTFYPKGLVQRRELEYLSHTLNSVEINGTFYSLQRPESFRRWAEQVPDDFAFAVKGPRFITHMKKLVDVDVPLANFFASGVLALGRRLGPVLWQLPATTRFDPAVLADFVGRLPTTTTAAADLATHHDNRLDGRALTSVDTDRPLRYALEVRNPEFADPAAYRILREANVALVLADSAGRFPVINEDTADFGYLRLHGDSELYVSGYTDEALDRWATTVRARARGGDVYVYFDNDTKVRAPIDARGLLGRLA